MDKLPPRKDKNKAAAADAAAAGPARSRTSTAAGDKALSVRPVNKKVTRRPGRRR
jgi:hypothetical protein